MLILRPSGATVLTNVAVKIFKNEEEAVRAQDRHAENPNVSVKVFLRRGDTLVMEMADTPASLDKGMDLSYLIDHILTEMWNTKTSSFRSTDLESYLKYVLRDKTLPKAFREQVKTATHWVENEPSNCEQIHGDLTTDNVLYTPNGYRLIDFSVREELAYKESDTAKFHFHEYRRHGEYPHLTGLEQFFFFCHFCRVWTRDVEARPTLERLHHEYITCL